MLTVAIRKKNFVRIVSSFVENSQVRQRHVASGNFKRCCESATKRYESLLNFPLDFPAGEQYTPNGLRRESARPRVSFPPSFMQTPNGDQPLHW
jgi:hypothetical protein